MIGQTLSHYKILEKLGEGGMGQVYIAEDTKLGRQVALKILPPEMASDERRMRFEREAKAVAALNHPNIVTIHSVEEADDVHFITMELVKGKTLTELVPRKGMPLNKFFEAAIPLADAVSDAHEQGIVHRDIKPDNLMVSDDGRLKILDYGLAKLKQEVFEAGASELPTQSATGEGRILGTAAYMSPEQAEGKKVDHRSDIFSMGIVLYEMATGERPFKGDSATAVLSSILKDTPQSAAEVNRSVPRELGKIIKRCLVKDPTRRYQTAADLRNELEELKQEVDSGELLDGIPATADMPKSKWFLYVTIFVLAVLVGILGYWILITDPPFQPTLTRVTSQPGQELFPSLSPDGEYVAYAGRAEGNWDIYSQRIQGETSFNLTDDCAADDTQPAISPDGQRIAFRSERDGGGIFLMGATSESVRRLTDFGFNPAWSPNGMMVAIAEEGITVPSRFGGASRLWIVNVMNGEIELVTVKDGVQPRYSPNGHRIGYWSSVDGQRDIWTIRLDGGEPVAVTHDNYIDWNPIWSPNGKSLYFLSDRGGTMAIWRTPIDEESGQALGSPEPVTLNASATSSHLDISGDGKKLAYVERLIRNDLWKVEFDNVTGEDVGEPIPVTKDSMGEDYPDVSPDGQKLVYRISHSARLDGAGQHSDICIMNAEGTDRRHLTEDLHVDRKPQWAPDGSKIAFFSNRSGSYEIWSIQPDGSGLTQITHSPGQLLMTPAWSPDGTRMSCYDHEGETSYIFDTGKPWSEQAPTKLPPFGSEEEAFHAVSWSPDGRWLAAYVAGTQGPVGIALFSLETQEYKRLTDFGMHPKWTNDSRAVIFNHASGLYLTSIESGETQEVLSLFPDTLWEPSFSPDNRWLYFGRVKDEADIWMLTLNEERE